MAKSQSLVMVGIHCNDSVQILLCSAMTCVFLCFRLLSARFLIGYCFVSRDNLQIKRAFILGFTHTAGFMIVNIKHVEYLRFAIGASPTFFRVDSVTLSTPHTTADAISLRLQGKLSFPYNCQKMNGQIYVLLC